MPLLRRSAYLIFTGLLLVKGVSSAFPPGPYYTLHGMVRDQVGQTVTAEGAEVILLKGGVEVGRTPIVSNRIDQPPFPRPPVRPNGCFRGLPPKANS